MGAINSTLHLPHFKLAFTFFAVKNLNFVKLLNKI